MTINKTMGRSGGNRSTHQFSYTKQKAESFRSFYANAKGPGDCNLDDLKDPVSRQKAVRWRDAMRASNRIKIFPEHLKDLAETNYLLKAKAFLAGTK